MWLCVGGVGFTRCAVAFAHSMAPRAVATRRMSRTPHHRFGAARQSNLSSTLDNFWLFSLTGRIAGQSPAGPPRGRRSLCRSPRQDVAGRALPACRLDARDTRKCRRGRQRYRACAIISGCLSSRAVAPGKARLALRWGGACSALAFGKTRRAGLARLPTDARDTRRTEEEERGVIEHARCAGLAWAFAR